jgi:hypothetical protein
MKTSDFIRSPVCPFRTLSPPHLEKPALKCSKVTMNKTTRRVFKWATGLVSAFLLAGFPLMNIWEIGNALLALIVCFEGKIKTCKNGDSDCLTVQSVYQLLDSMLPDFHHM